MTPASFILPIQFNESEVDAPEFNLNWTYFSFSADNSLIASWFSFTLFSATGTQPPEGSDNDIRI